MTGGYWFCACRQHLGPLSNKGLFPASLRLMIAALLLLAASHPATAQTKLHLFGHDVVVRSFVKHVGEEIINADVLLVDKKVLMRNRQIYLWKSGSFADIGFAVGMHSSGAMCDNHFFVLMFPASGPPSINGKFSACEVRYGIEKDHIVFETVHNHGEADESLRSRWIWTTSGLGLERHFNVKTGAAGNLLQSRSIQQPADLLEHAEFSEQIAQLAERSHFSEDDVLFGIIKGPGTVRYEANVMFGKACQAGDCSLGSLLVAVDIPSRKLYLALKSGNQAAIIAPEQTAWPPGTQRELSHWMAQSQSK